MGHYDEFRTIDKCIEIRKIKDISKIKDIINIYKDNIIPVKTGKEIKNFLNNRIKTDKYFFNNSSLKHSTSFLDYINDDYYIYLDDLNLDYFIILKKDLICVKGRVRSVYNFIEINTEEPNDITYKINMYS